jgi:hypothetical protein
VLCSRKPPKPLSPKIFDFPDLAVLLQQKEADKYSSPKALIYHLPADFIQHKFKLFSVFKSGDPAS